MQHVLFSNINGKVSLFALRLVYEQYERLSSEDKLPPCTHSFTETMGLPCCHVMQTLIEKNEPIPLFSIHKQWWLDDIEPAIINSAETKLLVEMVLADFNIKYDNALPHEQSKLLKQMESLLQQVPGPLLNPKVASQRGRPKGAKNKASITRDPSEFEFVEANYKVRKCTSCNQAGHNKRTCPEIKRNGGKETNSDEDSFTVVSEHDIKTVVQALITGDEVTLEKMQDDNVEISHT
ncbi:MAG TPA: hypothetical protein VIQ31_39655 [Phormidium sp.]